MVASIIQANGALLAAPTTTVVMGAYTPGSMLVAMAAARSRATVSISRSGWTELAPSISVPNTDYPVVVCYRPSSAGESTSLVFTASSSAGRLAVAEFGGVGSVRGFASATGDRNVQPCTVPLAGCLAGNIVVGCFTCDIGGDVGANAGYTPLAGWTELDDGNNGGSYPSINMIAKIAAADGTITPTTTYGQPFPGTFPAGFAAFALELAGAGAGGFFGDGRGGGTW